MPPRAASVPPKPLYRPEVESELMQTSTTARQGFRSAPYLPRPRPIVVYAGPRFEDRAMSVPPVVLYERAEQRYERRQASVPPRDDWRTRAMRASRARSVPPTRTYRAPSPPAPKRRYYYRGAAARAMYARPVREAGPLVPLPTAGLTAHKVPRRFLTRSGVRTGFGSLFGYYDHSRKERERPRILASPIARAKGRAYWYGLHAKPKPPTMAQSLSGFPQVYVPLKGPRPSNRSKVKCLCHS